MPEFIQVITTVEKREDAERIAQALVEKKLAACVQVLGPMTSFFRWQGKMDRCEEFCCQIKSSGTHYQELEETILALHPYEVPEIIALPIVAGSGGYLQWLATELK